MKNKQGISLIVLVITIIVMIILAATVVISLSNTGVIGKANEAVKKTSIKQVEQLASLAWAEGIMEKYKGDALKGYVLDKMKDYTDDYNIEVTDKGVTVTDNTGLTKNQYGFYYNKLYIEAEDDNYGIVFKENGIVDWYYKDTEVTNKYLSNWYDPVGYETGKILFDGWHFEVSKDGKTLIDPEDGYTCIYSDDSDHDFYYNTKYIGTTGYILVSPDNTITKYNFDGTLVETIQGTTLTRNSHVLESSVDENIYFTLSMDGTVITDYNYENYTVRTSTEKGTFRIYCDHLEYECQFEIGMTWMEWVCSSYNTINADLYELSNRITIFCPYNNDELMEAATYRWINSSEQIQSGGEYMVGHK